MPEEKETKNPFNYGPEPKSSIVRKVKDAVESFIDETNPSDPSVISEMVDDINERDSENDITLSDEDIADLEQDAKDILL